MIARLMGLHTVSPRALRQMLDAGGVTVVDVNSRQSWLAARVPGARHLDAMQYSAADLPAGAQSPLVFYCSNFLCRKAPNAARRAEQMGYRNVLVMSAGISGWTDAGLPTESGEEVAPVG